MGLRVKVQLAGEGPDPGVATGSRHVEGNLGYAPPDLCTWMVCLMWRIRGRTER